MVFQHQLPSYVSQVEASLSCRAEGLPWLWVLHGATEKSSWARRKTLPRTDELLPEGGTNHLMCVSQADAS